MGEGADSIRSRPGASEGALRPGRVGHSRTHRGKGRSRGLDVDRDGFRDLVLLFDLRDAEIAFGDSEACLAGELHDGTEIEGCDAIDTRPWWRRKRSRWHR